MPLSIAEAIQELPILSSVNVAAGRRGLDHNIRWTHIVDNPDMVPWVGDGILLVTTAFAIKDNPEIKTDLIARLVEKNVSGMMFSFGKYINEIDQEMIQMADKLDFPLLTIPWEVPLVEVTHAIHERIVHEQYDLIDQSYSIHRILTQIVVEGGGLDSLAKNLAQILNRSVSIDDSSLYLLAYSSVSPVDELRRRSIELGRTTPELSEYFDKIGLFEQLRKEPKPHWLAPLPDLGMQFERIVAPILVGPQLYGYIWVISGGGNLTELDYLAIERAANVAALIISREQAVYHAEQRVKTNLFENLIEPSTSSDGKTLTDILHTLGLHGTYHLILFEDTSTSPERMRQLNKMVDAYLNNIGASATLVEWGQRLILLLSAANQITPKELAEELLHAGSANGYCLRAGISSPSKQAAGVRDAYQEALNALRIGSALNKNASCVSSHSELGFWYYLLNLPAEVREKNEFSKKVKEIAEYDSQNKTELLKTLETYLDECKNSVKAAEVLYIHRNTLNQRINRVQTLWGINLHEENEILNIQIAIKDWRLNSVS